jgi:hypothetical protein
MILGPELLNARIDKLIDFSQLSGFAEAIINSLREMEKAHEKAMAENTKIRNEMERMRTEMKANTTSRLASTTKGAATGGSNVGAEAQGTLKDLSDGLTALNKRVARTEVAIEELRKSLEEKADKTTIQSQYERAEDSANVTSQNVTNLRAMLTRLEEGMDRKVEGMNQEVKEAKGSLAAEIRAVRTDLSGTRDSMRELEERVGRCEGDSLTNAERTKEHDERIGRHTGQIDELSNLLVDLGRSVDQQMALKADNYRLDDKADMSYVDELFEEMKQRVQGQVKKNATDIGSLKNDVFNLQSFVLQDNEAAGMYRCLSCSRIMPPEMAATNPVIAKRFGEVQQNTQEYSLQVDDGGIYRGRQENAPQAMGAMPPVSNGSPMDPGQREPQASASHWMSASPGSRPLSAKGRPQSAKARK